MQTYFSSQDSEQRLGKIDLLRGVAVILTLINHIPLIYLQKLPTGAEEVVSRIVHRGWIGVDLFFVLSGFLVSGLIFSEFKKYQTFDWKRFFVRRAFKIYPVFYLFLLVTIPYAQSTKLISKLGLFFEFAFLQNYQYGVWGHTWSLGVEEQFYLLLGITFWLAIRCVPSQPFKNLVFAIAAVNVLVLCLRFVVFEFVTPVSFATHFRATPFRIDSLLFGVLLSYLFSFKNAQFVGFFAKRRILLFSLAFFLVGLSIAPVRETFATYVFGLTGLYLGFGILLSLVITSPRMLKSWHSKLLATIGLYSYSIYVFHWPFQMLLAQFHDVCKDWHILVQLLCPFAYILICLLVGIIVSVVVEWPCLRLRNRLAPSRSAPSSGISAEAGPVKT